MEEKILLISIRFLKQLIENYRKGKVDVRANFIYARESDSNTDIDKTASANAIKHLWEERINNS